MGAERRRRGFALIIVVVTLAVMLILSTVILANTASARRADAVLAGLNELIRFGYEIGDNEKKPSFRGDVVAHPGRLSHLYVKITTGDRDSCGVPYSGAKANSWNGPYHLIPMVREMNYQLVPGVMVSDTLERNPPSGNGPATLSIVMKDVQLDMAQAFGMAMDGVSTGAGPKITFDPNVNPVVMRYNVPIDRC